jgi:CheY-like chemotaxis protein
MNRIRLVNEEPPAWTGDTTPAGGAHHQYCAMATVLLYEPDGALRDLLALQLTHLGHRIAERSEPHTIAVIEPASPEGLRAARELRASEPSTPLVLVSVYPPSPETLELEAVAHLVKPVLLADLQAALARCASAAR